MHTQSALRAIKAHIEGRRVGGETLALAREFAEEHQAKGTTDEQTYDNLAQMWPTPNAAAG